MESKYHNLGEFLKEYRRSKALTQEQFAETLQVTRARYNLYENGKAKVSIGNVAIIAAKTGKTTEFINKLNDMQGKPQEE